MKPYLFHITLYDLAFLGIIFISIILALLLWFTVNPKQRANRFLAAALVIASLRTFNILAIDIQLAAYVPFWSRWSLQFFLIFGPLLFFYARKITEPERRFTRRDLLHFTPLLPALLAQVPEIRESLRMGIETYQTMAFRQVNPILQLLTSASVIVYLLACRKQIEYFYRRQKFNWGDRYRFELRWLSNLLTGFGALWLLSMLFSAVDYFYYHRQLGVQAYYPMYLLLVSMFTWIAAMAHLKSTSHVPAGNLPVFRSLQPAELKQKGNWLKKIVLERRYFEDPELTLSSLAEKLNLSSHELSRIINTVLKKNFNDFVGEYRVHDVAGKMQDPAYERLNLMGIGYGSGFNSRTSFHRTFKQITGKSPAEYKAWIKKDIPTYNLEHLPGQAAIISYHKAIPTWSYGQFNRNYMLRNYFKIAWRYLAHNRVASIINIGGLAVGMAVAILIGLWVYDELTFNQYHTNYRQITQVLRMDTRDGERVASTYQPMPLAAELQAEYGRFFKHVIMTRQIEDHLLTHGDKKFTQQGCFMQKDGPDMLTLNMLSGSRKGLTEINSILLSATVAHKLFGTADPIGQLLQIDASLNARVTGVYEDLPDNSEFKDAAFIAPFDLYATSQGWIKGVAHDWSNQFVEVYAELLPGIDAAGVSRQIKSLYINHMDPQKAAKRKTVLFLQPMDRWHLYSKFENGVNVTSDQLKFVWFYSLIGGMVLLMACINFMNLSTARSQKRAREVGVRKAIGSDRRQLIFQFFGESLLVAGVAFCCSILLVLLALPWFNAVAGKTITLPWVNPLFWLASVTFVLITGLLAGSYPALYLSSFQPVKVLKGTFRLGSMAVIPRKLLIVVQFTVSIALIIGTLIVYRQLQFTKDRPVGYSQESLLMVNLDTKGKYEVLRSELKKAGMVSEIAESGSPLTGVNNMNKGFHWKGKDEQANDPTFNTITITPEYGKTVGWKFVGGRDFSTELANDSAGFVINEAAAKLMGFKDPLGQPVKWETEWRPAKNYTIIGVVKDMVMESPYAPVNPAVFFIQGGGGNIFIKINPKVSASEAIAKIGRVVKKLMPDEQFNYQFVDEAYAAKFAAEERVGKLAGVFAALAIFISCLGVFAMASLTAEQRAREIGIRKVLGANLLTLWSLLSFDIVKLVIISLVIASPVTYYVMINWLQNYQYRTGMSLWLFLGSGLGAIIITLVTVSFQSIKAALVNPVKSLRSE